MRFGGRVAVDRVDLRVGAHELVGLIGTNGAGKSTLMNAIGGFIPCDGRVEVLGRDVTRLPAYRRHRHGLGRSFQAARLYDDLTVRETVMVALEGRARSRLLPSMLHLPPSPRAERAKRAEADEILDGLGLGATADQPVASLSTGTRRMVELAGQVALGARVLLLDEPTAGLSQRETEAFAPRIRRDPARARRRGAADRARHPAGDVGERPRLLPRGGPRDRRGNPGAGARRPARDRQLPRCR